MEKLDLVKKHRDYFTARQLPQFVTFEAAPFLSITGKGDPSGREFAEHVQVMYSTAYTIKFNFKSKGKDFVVSKLEAQWWYDEAKYQNVSMDEAPEKIPRSEWGYRLLIRIPDFVREDDVRSATKVVKVKKDLDLAMKVELLKLEEGTCVQMLHVGPFNNEPETLKVMKDFMVANNLRQNGLHHEIYLSDFRKTAPEKLRTILREPVIAG